MKKTYKINKWGSSGRVSIPSHIWKELSWKQTDEVTYNVVDGKLIVEKKKQMELIKNG